ncbi:MAG: DUF6220 domain-containing protein, partial [Chloroflexota bacterium]
PWLAVIFVGCLVVQVFLAGMGAFGKDGFIQHRDWAYTFGYLVLVNLIVALVGRLPRRIVGLTALALVLFALQSVLVALRESYPAIAALHAVNGFSILLVSIVIARDTWPLRKASPAPTPSPEPVVEPSSAG